MRLESFLNPLTVCALAAVALSMSVALFVGIKREMAKSRNLAGAWQIGLESDLKAEIDSLRQSVLHLEEMPAARPAGASLNLTKRTQAIRMHRRGESIPTIAAALETPSNEIALLLKVHALLHEEPSKGDENPQSAGNKNHLADQAARPRSAGRLAQLQPAMSPTGYRTAPTVDSRPL